MERERYNKYACVTPLSMDVVAGQHCLVVPSPLNAFVSVKPQLNVNTIIPKTVQMTAGNLALEYQGPLVKTKYADAGNYLSALLR
jgi:hypothetical protein